MSADGLVARLHAAIDEREKRYTDQLHERRAHPDFEYLLDVQDETPEGVWEPNVPADDEDAKERWAYQEESYWRRLRADGTRQQQPGDTAIEALRLCQAHRDILNLHSGAVFTQGCHPEYEGNNGFVKAMELTLAALARGYGVEDGERGE